MLIPNFQSIISRTNNRCSLLSFIFAKLLLLGVRCQNIFALSILIALIACPFSVKKCVKMSIFFYVKAVKICWLLGFHSHTPGFGPLFCQILGAPLVKAFFCSSLDFSGKMKLCGGENFCFAFHLILVKKYINALKEQLRSTFSKKGRLSKIG